MDIVLAFYVLAGLAVALFVTAFADWLEQPDDESEDSPAVARFASKPTAGDTPPPYDQEKAA